MVQQSCFSDHNIADTSSITMKMFGIKIVARLRGVRFNKRDVIKDTSI